MIYTIKELQNRDVINICNGTILGHIVDVEIDINCGKINAVIVACGKGFWSISGETLRICWEQIQCVGEDAILVEYKSETCCKDNNNRRHCSGLFGIF